MTQRTADTATHNTTQRAGQRSFRSREREGREGNSCTSVGRKRSRRGKQRLSLPGKTAAAARTGHVFFCYFLADLSDPTCPIYASTPVLGSCVSVSQQTAHHQQSFIRRQPPALAALDTAGQQFTSGWQPPLLLLPSTMYFHAEVWQERGSCCSSTTARDRNKK